MMQGGFNKMPPKRGRGGPFKKKMPPIESPAEVLSKLLKIPQSDIKAAIPYTVSAIDGRPTEGFCAVINEGTYLYENGKEVYSIENSEIKAFEFEDGFGCAMLNLVKTDGSYKTLCRSDMKKKDLYMGSASEFTMAATGHGTEFGSTKKVFSGRTFSGPSHGGPFGFGGPPHGGGKRPEGGKGAHGGRACPKCGRPYRPGTSKCISCDKSKGYLKWMFSMVKPFTPRLILAVVLFFAVTAINLITPMLNRIMVDDYINSKETITEFQGFFLVLLSILGVQIVVRLVGMLRSVITNGIGCSITEKLRETVFGKIQQLSVSAINRMTAGELMQRVTQDTMVIKNFISTEFSATIEQGLTFLGVIILLIVYDWKLALLIVLPAPVVMLFWRLFSKKMHRLYRRQWEFSSESRSILHDIFSGIRVVKAYGSEEKEIGKYDGVITKEKGIQIRNEKFFGRIHPFISFFMGFGEFFLMFYAGNKILGGEMTLGEMSQFSSYASMIYGPLRWMSNLPRQFIRVNNSISKIYDIMEDPDTLEKRRELEMPINGEITFEDVGFGYEKGNQVFEKINFTIKPGEMVGLVGRSGVGKSTLINLVMRMYDAEKGRILIDGNDIKDLSQTSLRSQIGVVLQETFLFSGTVYDNISYAKPGATKEEVISAAKAAGAHKFIIKMQDGYNTYIGEHGYTLSGGERQRIAIARALLRDPRILILDEATSALDNETEKEIQDALAVLAKDRTTIAIAHRLSTLRNCDRIIVMDSGTLAEIGSHNELMKMKGIYYGLVMAQRQMFRMKKETPEAAAEA